MIMLINTITKHRFIAAFLTAQLIYKPYIIAYASVHIHNN